MLIVMMRSAVNLIAMLNVIMLSVVMSNVAESLQTIFFFVGRLEV